MMGGTCVTDLVTRLWRHQPLRGSLLEEDIERRVYCIFCEIGAIHFSGYPISDFIWAWNYGVDVDKFSISGIFLSKIRVFYHLWFAMSIAIQSDQVFHCC